MGGRSSEGAELSKLGQLITVSGVIAAVWVGQFTAIYPTSPRDAIAISVLIAVFGALVWILAYANTLDDNVETNLFIPTSAHAGDPVLGRVPNPPDIFDNYLGLQIFNGSETQFQHCTGKVRTTEQVDSSLWDWGHTPAGEGFSLGPHETKRVFALVRTQKREVTISLQLDLKRLKPKKLKIPLSSSPS